MSGLDHKLGILNELIRRLDDLKYRDRDTLWRLCTDTRLFIRRVFGQESVWMHDFELIQFEPQGLIANSEHYLMTGAWTDGSKLMGSILQGMKTELVRYGEPRDAFSDITVDWLIKNLPLKLWWALGGLILSAIGLGITLGQTTFVKELLHIR